MPRKTKFSLLFFIIITSLIFIPLGQSSPSQVSLTITPDSPYYLHGETAVFNINSNISIAYTFTVYDVDEKIIWQKNRQTDQNGKDTVNLPVQSTLAAGFYKVKANCSESTATTIMTLVNTKGYSSTTFPFSRSHKGVTYTIKAKGFTAVSSSGSISVQYPSLPVSFQVNAFQNNMSLVERLKNTALGINIDLSYLFICNGLKILINGSIPEPTTYSFAFDNPRALKKKLDSLRDGFLIFDWSDMRKATQQFSYNHESGKLTVNIPQSFRIDPYVFEDGFESNDFSAWTGTTTSGGTIQTSDVNPHSGSYHANASITGTGTRTAYCYKTGFDESRINVREYVYFHDRVTNGTSDEIMVLQVWGDTALFQMGIRSWDAYWGGRYRKAGVWTAWNNVSLEASLNTPYCVETEFYVHATEGWFKAYLDDTLIFSDVNIDTSQNGNAVEIRCGVVQSVLNGDYQHSVDLDCVVVDSSYIGPEAGSNTAPTIGEFTCDSTVYANKYSLVNATVNDADGVGDFENCTIQLNGTIQLKWANTTNTFTELADASNYCTLDASNSVKTSVNSTALKLSWKIKLYWNYTEGSIFINGTVFDDEPESGTGGPSSLFTFEDDLMIYSVSHSPPEPELGQTFTVSGQLYYTGTSTAPEDGTGITVNLWKAGFLIASTTTVTTGQFSISHSEPEAGEYYYTVYSQTDEVSTQNQTERVDVVKGGSGTYTPPSDPTPENNQTTPSTPPLEFTPSPGQGKLNISPVLIVGLIAVGILIVSAYTPTSNLKLSRKQWKKKKKGKNQKWKQTDGKKIKWEKGKALD